MADSQVLKQLKIKTAVVQRTQKELLHYHKELEDQKAKVAKMRAAAADEYDIKKQVEVQAETEVMIPDTMRRLGKAVDDLRGYISMSESDASVAGTEQLTLAKKVLEEIAPEEGANNGGAGGGDDDRI